MPSTKLVKQYDNLVKQAVSHIQKSEVQDAKDTLKSAIDLMPERPAAHGYLGNVFFNESDFQSAEAHYRESFSVNPYQNYILRERLVKCIKSRDGHDDIFRTIDKDILEVHRLHWQQNYGSISPCEAQFLRELIHTERPQQFLEIGTASGLSTGLIASSMELAGLKQSRLRSIDLDTHFWVDRDQPTGFLAERIYDGDMVEVAIDRGVDATSLANDESGVAYDMMFIDANHQHPWPTLDMIAALPHLKPHGVIAHHDLALYLKQTPIYGIGPKYLYDQMPKNIRVNTWDHEKNIYALKLDRSYSELEDRLIKSLYLPWTNRHKLEQDTVDRFLGIIESSWSPKLAEALVKTREKFDVRLRKKL